MYDAQAGIYKMWYGGAYTAYAQDNIYYATSADGITWSAPTTLLTVSSFQASYYAFTGQTIAINDVNDPSITKHFNTANQQYQYTMFFTVQQCTATSTPPCGQDTNRLWSMTSLDGINFDFPVPLNIPGEGSTIWSG